AMKIDPSQWVEAAPYLDDRPAAPPIPEHHLYPVRAYNPLQTLRPRTYSATMTPSDFGYHIGVATGGTDIAQLHTFNLSVGTDTLDPELQFAAGYGYSGFPVDLSIGISRTITPQAGPYALGSNYAPLYTQENTGISTSIGYSLPGAFDGQSVSLSYSATRVANDLPVVVNKLDPYETPRIPGSGLVSDLHLGWGYSNAQSFLWGVAGEKGFSLSANIDATHPALGSDYTGYGATVDFTSYHVMPWLRHHSLALHAGAGTGGGSFPGRGPFYIGGFVDLPVYDTVRNILIQGGVTLRGYAPVVEAGNNYALFNGEYRFPIMNIDRGYSTLPIFIQRINGAVFCDYGSAFNDASTAEFKTGVGGELWFDTSLAYVLNFTFRLGYAKGLASGGLDKFYFVAAVPF
ncbi:MAG: BamA/TamA family outer membrane protein, partial [Polyangiaceae bacterium]